MLKKILLAGLFCTAVSGAALASETPTTPEQCAALITQTTAMFGDKTLADDVAKQVDELSEQLNKHCAENKFEDAANAAKALGELAPKG